MTVLIADGDTAFRQDLANWIRDQKHEVLEAINSNHALDQIHKRPVEMSPVGLIITEYDLGLIMNAKKFNPTTLICVLLSPQRHMEKSAQRAGANWTLLRTCSHDHLKAKLQL
jgi:DNA-binding NtrC family response regulator